MIQTQTLSENFINIHYSENFGVAFSLPLPFALIIILNILLLITLFYFGIKELNMDKKLTQFSLSLIIAGGIGNLIDRIAHGFVIDFISIWKWPTFNLADIYIVAGILMILTFYAKVKKV